MSRSAEMDASSSSPQILPHLTNHAAIASSCKHTNESPISLAVRMGEPLLIRIRCVCITIWL